MLSYFSNSIVNHCGRNRQSNLSYQLFSVFLCVCFFFIIITKEILVFIKSIMDFSSGASFLPNGEYSLFKTSVLFVSISFIVLMIISLVWLIFYYVQRFRYLQTKDKQSRRLCSVAKRIISKIPTKNLRSDDKEVENDCCAVCIEPYKVADYLRILPCGHHFHKVCIDPWLLEHRTCPMCKMDILKHYGFVVGSQASTNTIIIDYMIGNDSNPIAQPRNNVASSNSSGNLSSISASNSSPNRSTNNSDDTESRQITDV